jgi:hypothetical protein
VPKVRRVTIRPARPVADDPSREGTTFYDAAVEEGLSEAHEAHMVYCENQGTRGPQNG